MRNLGRWLMVACLLGSAAAHAQTYPTRQVEMLIPFSAGAGSDLIVRVLADAMSAQLKQSVIPINRGGAIGTLAFNALATATPDGYTLGAGPSTPITNAPFIMKGIRYTADSFDYICNVFNNVFMIAVRPDSPFKSAQDLFDAARRSPGKLTFAHSGVGATPYLSMEDLADTLELKFQHVPFRQSPQAFASLLEGSIDVSITTLIPDRNVRMLLVFADERHPLLPRVPAAKEFGVKRSPPAANGVFAPAGLPAPVRAELERACAQAVKGDEMRHVMEKTGNVVDYLPGEQFRALVVADYKFKGELMHRLGVKPE